MEFDKNTQPISDEARRIAETKQVTLQPVHDDVAPDPLPDAEIVAHHIIAPAIGNTPNDTEQTSSYLQPSREVSAEEQHKRSIPSLSKITIAGGAVIIIALTFLALRFM